VTATPTTPALRATATAMSSQGTLKLTSLRSSRNGESTRAFSSLSGNWAELRVAVERKQN
jgi:hypothetical protein